MLARILGRDRWRNGLIAALLVALAPAAPAAAAGLEAISADASVIELPIEALHALPQVTIVTGNAFVTGEVAYTGPLMRDLLPHLGLANAKTVRLSAANDYFVDIPTSDFVAYDAILALSADGRPLSLRDRGPLWLMYPISDHPELAARSYLRRLIWQVVRIEAL